jgi:hypothetical protein
MDHGVDFGAYSQELGFLLEHQNARDTNQPSLDFELLYEDLLPWTLFQSTADYDW